MSREEEESDGGWGDDFNMIPSSSGGCRKNYYAHRIKKALNI